MKSALSICILFFAVLISLPVPAQSLNSGTGLSPGPLTLPKNTQIPSLFEVIIELKGSSGDTQLDAEIRQSALARVGIKAGEKYDQFLADAAALRLRRIAGVRNTIYRLQSRINPDGVTLIFSLSIDPLAKSLSLPDGYFTKYEKNALPLLYQDEKSTLTLTLNGGNGLFLDSQPWFGAPGVFTRNNPLVPNPALGAQTGPSTSWTENYVELGLGGSMQLGESPYYVYGAASTIGVMSAGQDIFWSGSRATNNIEKLYAGLMWVGTQGGNAQISIGRQNFSLNDGFLISQYGSQYNAGPRPGIYLAPRTTQDFSILSQLQWGEWTAKAFLLDPNEYEPIESNTRIVGANLRYTSTPSIYADVSMMRIVQSDNTYRDGSGARLDRQGLNTLSGHLRWSDPGVAKGVWVESELAHQTHSSFSMSAWAGYGTVGYLADHLPWSPSISYRYTNFSGDNPNTSTFERFDPLFSGGLAEWLQGISFGKILNQTNRTTHRVRLNVSPVQELNLTLDYYINFANQFNNVGGNPALSQLSSKDLGQELQFVTRWAISKNFYFLGVLSYAMPGQAIKNATSMTGVSAKPWTTIQAQLFWNW